MFRLIKALAAAIIVFAAALPVGALSVVEARWEGYNPCLPGLTPATLIEEIEASKLYASRDFPSFFALVAFFISLSGVMKFEFERLFWPVLLPVGFLISVLGRGAKSAGALREWPDGFPFIWEQAAALVIIALLWKVPVKDGLVLSSPGGRTSDARPAGRSF